MALTATASTSTRQEVIEILVMNNPSVYAVSPHKSNVTYWVAERDFTKDCMGCMCCDVCVLLVFVLLLFYLCLTLNQLID